ncbi:hypothetical protein LTR94_034400, partial [Friedmanniomyces endolithicus]
PDPGRLALDGRRRRRLAARRGLGLRLPVGHVLLRGPPAPLALLDRLPDHLRRQRRAGLDPDPRLADLAGPDLAEPGDRGEAPARHGPDRLAGRRPLSGRLRPADRRHGHHVRRHGGHGHDVGLLRGQSGRGPG